MKQNIKDASDEKATFDAAMKALLSVSHEELKRREEAWKKNQKRKKRPKSGASRASGVV